MFTSHDIESYAFVLWSSNCLIGSPKWALVQTEYRKAATSTVGLSVYSRRKQMIYRRHRVASVTIQHRLYIISHKLSILTEDERNNVSADCSNTACVKNVQTTLTNISVTRNYSTLHNITIIPGQLAIWLLFEITILFNVVK